MMNAEIKAEWENDETHRCPYCGGEDFDWEGSDDGKTDVHWFAWECCCHDCGNEWYIEYDMVNPRVYGKDGQ